MKAMLGAGAFVLACYVCILLVAGLALALPHELSMPIAVTLFVIAIAMAGREATR